MSILCFASASSAVSLHGGFNGRGNGGFTMCNGNGGAAFVCSVELIISLSWLTASLVAVCLFGGGAHDLALAAQLT